MKKTVITIARDLGVAPSTVSKVINQKGNFSDDLRKKVLDYIREIEYVPATSARVLKSTKSWTIGVIYTEESSIGLEHPFFSSVLQSFKDYIEKVGYDLSFIVKQVGSNHMSYLNWCKNKKVDGVLIVVGSHNNPEIIELVESNIPCVSTDVVRENLHSIISDNEMGIRLSIEHGIELGKKRIAMISGPHTARHFLYRFRVYKNVLEEKGFNYGDKYHVTARGFGYTSGFDAAFELIKKNSEIPDYIIVGSDLLAFGAIAGFEELGYKIPEDISVIGFDDISFARMYKPSLTTIHQNMVEIGNRAAEILIHKIDNHLPNLTEITMIPVELIKRESTK